MGPLRCVRTVLASFFGHRYGGAVGAELAGGKSCSIALATLLTLASPAAVHAFAPQDATAQTAMDTMAQRMQACALCHGKEGRATRAGYFPRIAGKPAGYLFNQLKNFQEGRRSNQTMNQFLLTMSDDYLHEIADYFAALDLPYPPAASSGLDAAQQGLAQSLALHGAPERKIPACVACHGSQLAGRLPATPGLLSLPAFYLSGQLGAWRTNTRKAKAPDCMADIAKRLEPEEIDALAHWLSSQSLPAGTQPERASTQLLPLACGSAGR